MKHLTKYVALTGLALGLTGGTIAWGDSHAASVNVASHSTAASVRGHHSPRDEEGVIILAYDDLDKSYEEQLQRQQQDSQRWEDHKSNDEIEHEQRRQEIEEDLKRQLKPLWPEEGGDFRSPRGRGRSYFGDDAPRSECKVFPLTNYRLPEKERCRLYWKCRPGVPSPIYCEKYRQQEDYKSNNEIEHERGRQEIERDLERQLKPLWPEEGGDFRSPGGRGRSYLRGDDDPSEEPFSSRVPARLVGKWRESSSLGGGLSGITTYTFNSDGTYRYEAYMRDGGRQHVFEESGTLSVQGGHLTLRARRGTNKTYARSGDLLEERRAALKTEDYRWRVGMTRSGREVLQLSDGRGTSELVRTK